MIYGSDCQGLLKPIQFQDSGSHFLSFMAQLMNSHYQPTCFIIVKTLIEVVFLKKNYQRGKKNQGSFTTFLLSCARALNCCDWSLQPHAVPCQCPLLVLLRFSGPFLDQMVKAVDSGAWRMLPSSPFSSLWGASE